MLNNFNSIVLQVSVIILIILLIIVGLVMYYSSKNAEFPPIVSECPDYWNIQKNGNNTKCLNYLKVNPLTVSNNDRCNQIDTISFKDVTDEQTLCNKYKWAKSCNVIWDGVTNNNSSCVI